MVPASGVLAVVSALSIATRYKARLGAAGIVAFLVPVTFTMHKFWAISDPMMAQLQQVMFMKNISLIGAAIYLVYAGAGSVQPRWDSCASIHRQARSGCCVVVAARPWLARVGLDRDQRRLTTSRSCRPPGLVHRAPPAVLQRL